MRPCALLLANMLLVPGLYDCIGQLGFKSQDPDSGETRETKPMQEFKELVD